LRSGDFTQKYGIAATIMDYARYNYVAQPGDKNVRFIRQMGPYDHYAINWGYRKIPNVTTSQEEVKTLDKWISNKAGNPIYRFGGQSFDPSAQTEGIGNDQVKASTYGIKNLKVVAKNLSKWTSDKTNNYEDLSELYDELLGVWSRYAGHVAGNIGGVYEFNKKPIESGVVYEYVSKTKQQESLQWLLKNVFETQDWLLDKSILANINESGYTSNMLNLQTRQLNGLLNESRLKRMLDATVIEKDFYPVEDFFRELKSGIFSEANYTSNLDIFRRNLQKAFIEKMGVLMSDKNLQNTDIPSIVRGELDTMKIQLTIAKSRFINKISKYHYADCLEKINKILDPK